MATDNVDRHNSTAAPADRLHVVTDGTGVLWRSRVR
jgi:hypothetical protein